MEVVPLGEIRSVDALSLESDALLKSLHLRGHGHIGPIRLAAKLALFLHLFLQLPLVLDLGLFLDEAVFDGQLRLDGVLHELLLGELLVLGRDGRSEFVLRTQLVLLDSLDLVNRFLVGGNLFLSVLVQQNILLG